MIIKGEYHSLIIKKDPKGRFLLERDKDATEKIIFERLLNYPEVVEISYPKKERKMFFTQIGRSSFFTAHLGYDLTCPLTPRIKSYEDQDYIKDTQIDHFFSLEGLLEEHLRKMGNKEISWNRELPLTASYTYARLVNALASNASMF